MHKDSVAICLIYDWRRTKIYRTGIFECRVRSSYLGQWYDFERHSNRPRENWTETAETIEFSFHFWKLYVHC